MFLPPKQEKNLVFYFTIFRLSHWFVQQRRGNQQKYAIWRQRSAGEGVQAPHGAGQPRSAVFALRAVQTLLPSWWFAAFAQRIPQHQRHPSLGQDHKHNMVQWFIIFSDKDDGAFKNLVLCCMRQKAKLEREKGRNRIHL